MYALLLTWDIQTEAEREYINFVLGEYIPTLERLGLTLRDALFKIAGEGAQVFAFAQTSDAAVIERALKSAEFQAVERRLLTYVGNFKRQKVTLPQNFPQSGR